MIEQIVELQLRGPGPPNRTCTSINGNFHDKTKFIGKSLNGLLFTIGGTSPLIVNSLITKLTFSLTR